MNSHWQGDQYSQNSDFQFRRALTLLDGIAFHGDEQVLDVGCGDGRISAEIAQRLPQGRVLAVDYSNDMISYAKSNHQLANLRFELGNAAIVSYQQEFNVVTSFFCLQWVVDKQKAFSGVFESLHPGGRAVLIMPVRNEVLAQARAIVLNHPEWRDRFTESGDATTPLTDTNYREYAVRAGFQITSYVRQPEEIVFSNRERLTGFVKSITAHLSSLSSEEEKETFMEQLIDAYLELVPVQPAGQCSITYDFITLLANKPR